MNSTIVRHFVIFDNPEVMFTVFLLAAPIVAVLIMVCLMVCKFCSMIYWFAKVNSEIEIHARMNEVVRGGVTVNIEDPGHLFRYKSEVTPVKKKSKVT